jgi:hypothetical protein
MGVTSWMVKVGQCNHRVCVRGKRRAGRRQDMEAEIGTIWSWAGPWAEGYRCPLEAGNSKETPCFLVQWKLFWTSDLHSCQDDIFVLFSVSKYFFFSFLFFFKKSKFLRLECKNIIRYTSMYYMYFSKR